MHHSQTLSLRAQDAKKEAATALYRVAAGGQK